MFIVHDDDGDDAKRTFFAETDLVEQHFYKNKQCLKNYNNTIYSKIYCKIRDEIQLIEAQRG